MHARSVVAHAMDVQTGEIFKARLCPDPLEVTAWIKALPGPAAAIYETGPTGYGLARTLLSHDIRTVVAAPSKLQKPAGSRVKTDAIDAEHLSTLLRLDAFTAVTVPDELTEAARDLVRAREDCRSDLMRSRHRLSKLLLRHGIVYSGGQAWVGAHDAWLRRQRVESPLLQAAFDEAYDSVVTITARRDRLDERIEAMAVDGPWTDTIRRLGCLRGISTLTGFGLAVEIGDWNRFSGNSIGSYLGLVPSENSSGQSRLNRPGFRSVLEARMEHDEPEVLSRDARARAADAR
ncbi:IS110 family RNA-guided transposase [Acidipropionibacterium timonense]|uniref:IS110 family transposase n=1 Tax=Acidipropionibacterium timonense TaxID=2161818 RepID=UPI0014367828|nr:IS110 family transposase [Acidipropionibacterium timonense]